MSPTITHMESRYHLLADARLYQEKERALQEAKESEERYRSLFENANDAIVTFTLDGIITAVNRGLEALLGWSREELIGQHYGKLTTPASVAAGEERTRQFLAGERPSSIFEAEFVRKDGSVVPVEARTRPIFDKEGHLIGIQGIYRDLTERKRVEAALQQANRLKDDFLATMSHELRTPLNIVMGYTDLLLGGDCGPLTVEQSDFLRRVQKAAHQELALVTVMLDVSRLEAGRLTVNTGEIPLLEVLSELAAEVQEWLREKPTVSCSWEVALGLPVLHTDRLKLKVVLKNLLDNAVKFTERGSITVAVRPLESGVEFRVADTGVGIPPEVQAVMFEMFRQGDSSTTRCHGGVGLGLYLVRRLLEILGGTVLVESEVGKGSTFRVWTPQNV